VRGGVEWYTIHMDAVHDSFFGELRRVIPSVEDVVKLALGSLREHPGSDAPRDAQKALERLLDVCPDDLVLGAIVDAREDGTAVDEDGLIASAEHPYVVRRMLEVFTRRKGSDSDSS